MGNQGLTFCYMDLGMGVWGVGMGMDTGVQLVEALY